MHVSRSSCSQTICIDGPCLQPSTIMKRWGNMAFFICLVILPCLLLEQCCSIAGSKRTFHDVTTFVSDRSHKLGWRSLTNSLFQFPQLPFTKGSAWHEVTLEDDEGRPPFLAINSSGQGCYGNDLDDTALDVLDEFFRPATLLPVQIFLELCQNPLKSEMGSPLFLPNIILNLLYIILNVLFLYHFSVSSISIMLANKPVKNRLRFGIKEALSSNSTLSTHHRNLPKIATFTETAKFLDRFDKKVFA